jgi:hypothetical protein
MPLFGSGSGVTKLVTLLVVVVVVAGGSAAGYEHFHDNRSVGNYCKTFISEGEKLRQQYNTADQQQTEQNPITFIATALGVPTQVAQLFDKLDKVAPDDIEPDIATEAHFWHQQAESQGQQASSLFSGNPFGALAGSLISSLADAPTEQRIDSYTSAHCPAPPR